MQPSGSNILFFLLFSADLFRIFEPVLTPYSIVLANGTDAKARRQAMDKVFDFDCLEIYYDKLQKVNTQIPIIWISLWQQI